MPIRSLIYMAVATVIGAGAAQSQQREAVLQRIEIAGAAFEIVIAAPKPGGASADYRATPDPNLVYLGDGNLVYAYTGDRQDPAGRPFSSHRPALSTSSAGLRVRGRRLSST